MVRMGPAVIGPMNPFEKAFLYVILRIILPTAVLWVLFEPLATLYLIGWLSYGFFLSARWAIRQDRKDKERGQLDTSLWDDLKDIEKMVTGSFGPERKKLKKGGRRKDPRTGDYMTCIMCSEYTNSAGMYCDDHDD